MKSLLIKWISFWPPFLFSGIKVKFLTPDFRHIKTTLKLRFYNSNYVGTQFGGLLYSMTDPFYMLMLIKNLGKEYIVWDKASYIQYLKPGTSDVTAEFILTEEEISNIKEVLKTNHKMDFKKTVEIKDKDQVVIATVEKTIYIRKL